MVDSDSHGPLGEKVAHPEDYAPEVLHPIARQPGRDRLNLPPVSLYGEDIWNAYELSWLDPKGKPRVACAEIRIPADSACIVESKSLKLYLNSLNQHRFSSVEAVTACIRDDLERVLGCQCGVSLLLPERWSRALAVSAPRGECLDEQDITVECYSPAPELLRANPEAEPVDEQLFSNLLRSRCPVTGQPDWASVEITYRGAPIDRDGLLGYLISFRRQDDFHEHCVEQIFADLIQRCAPASLTVSARYLRRGGLDINPWRSTEPSHIEENRRLPRQ